jgi:very-short-patch-repair endonuclease
MVMLSTPEELLALHIKACGLPEPKREYAFYVGRRFRSDFAWPDHKVLAEVEGGIWTKGRHTRGSGYQSDCKKYNLAALNGFKVFRFTPDMIRNGEAISTLTLALKGAA